MSSSITVSPNYSLSFTDRLLVHLPDTEINAISGATAGVISALAVCPLDVVKTKLQAQGGLASLQKQYTELGSELHSNVMLHNSARVHHQKTPNIPSINTSSNIITNTTHISSINTSPSSNLSSKLPNPAPVTSSSNIFSAPKYKGVFGTLSTIVREEGIPGLYRGVIPITVGYLPTWAIYFVVYEEIRKRASKSYPNHPFLSTMVSALTAGASSTLVTNPIWVVKTRLMTQTLENSYYTGTIDAFRKMYTEEGLLSFYAGLGPALLGLLHVAVQFPLYEKFKTLFSVDDSKPKLHQAHQILASSVLSKICASTITYPHEVIRTRIQIQPTFKDTSTKTDHIHSHSQHGFSPFKRSNKSPVKYHGIIQTTKTIFLEEGWRAFYSGLGTNMIRTVPASALTLLSYEVIASTLRDRQQRVLNLVQTPPNTPSNTSSGTDTDSSGTKNQDIKLGA